VTGLRLGVADHLGWAVAVTAAPDGRVVDRRRLELVEPGEPKMPIHHGIEGLDDAAAAALVARVHASAGRATSAALDALMADLPAPIESISLRALPAEFPTDIAVLRRPPYEARADAVMYRQVLAGAAEARGWQVGFYDAKAVERQAADVLGDAAAGVLHGPRSTLGPPWTEDHRVALAATIVAT